MTRGQEHNGNDDFMLQRLRQDMERGLRFTNIMLTVTQEQSNEAVSYVQALIDLLVRNKLIREEDLEEPLERARKEIEDVLMPRVRLAEMGDKYSDSQSVLLDCPGLIPLCHGRCCTFRFYLSKQDLEEGAALWDYGNPYWIRQTDDGFCVHSDPATRLCKIHTNRPHICRKYDCRNDKRIWLDFEKRIPAPMPDSTERTPIAMAEVSLKNLVRQAAEAAQRQAQTEETETQ